MTNPDNFLLNTDYELDKIILISSGSFVGRLEIPHNLSVTPLPFGVWSSDENFYSSNPLGAVEYGGVGDDVDLGVECRANDSKIILESHGAGSESTRVYYRLSAFLPSDANIDVGATSEWAHTFVLNTDFNYKKLLQAGEFDQNSRSFAHNLGYIPQVMAWLKYIHVPQLPEISDMVVPVAFSYANESVLKITNTTISTDSLNGGMFDKVIWRVYYDKA